MTKKTVMRCTHCCLSLSTWNELFNSYLYVLGYKLPNSPDEQNQSYKQAFAMLIEFNSWMSDNLRKGPISWSVLQERLITEFNSCREARNHVAGSAFLAILQDVREHYDEGQHLLEHIPCRFIWNDKLHYCGLTMPVVNNCAVYIDENGPHVFPLEADWWYNIEYYCYLQRGWEEV